jgi:hypothetical protein
MSSAMPKFLHNWKTSLAGAVAFVFYLAGQEITILPILPVRYHGTAHTIFIVAILLMGFAAKDSGTVAPAAAPPKDQTG